MHFIEELASDAVFDHTPQGRFRSFGEMVMSYYSNTEYVRTPEQIRRDEWILWGTVRCRAWMIIPLAVLSQFCLGSLYAWSIFNRPIDLYMYGDATANKAQITFYIALGMLGASGAVFGPWIESHSPRMCALLAAAVFFSGHCTAALGLACKTMGMLYFGYGFVGGIGLGIGYVTTIDAVIKWYPRSRGFASGLAVSGFGAGAVAFSNLNTTLLRVFSIPEAFSVLGAINLVVMTLCASLIRPPHPDYNIPGVAMEMVDHSMADLARIQHQMVQQTIRGKRTTVGGQVVTVASGSGDPILAITLGQALATRDFWLMWVAFFVNLVFGVVIISNLASMTTNMFGAAVPVPVATVVTIEGAFNAGGRLLSGWISDTLGRRRTFMSVITLQIIIVACLLLVIPQRTFWPFVVLVWLATLCYGGGVGVIAATLADMFGAPNMSSCHGVILTGWSVASIGGGLTYTSIVNHMTHSMGYTLSDPFVYVVNQYWILSLLACGWVALLFIRITPRDRMFPSVHGQVFRQTLAGCTFRLVRGAKQHGLRDYEFLAQAPEDEPAVGSGQQIIDGDDDANSSNLNGTSVGAGEKRHVGYMDEIDLGAHAMPARRDQGAGRRAGAGEAVTMSTYTQDDPPHNEKHHHPAPEAFNYIGSDRKSMFSGAVGTDGSCVQLTCTTPPPRRCVVLFGRWRLEHVSAEEVSTIWRMYLSCALLASSNEG
ncbi:hypothetical protein H4R18_000829 [Coemansia javaensis]|uniref:MFS general substrate transporter n=1 Tax=Coemansia javaensis TaxID=2761396 RepID=A0A9W8LMF8_9FUNG|nr:hypothetical protein H4R18_000829 [Coemansia javaensis]